MALIAEYDSVYRKKGTGNPVCRYRVTGSATELKAYKKAQGEFYVEDKVKGPLFFDTRYHGKSVNLIITEAGSVIADNEEQLLAQMTIEQTGGNLGEALAKEWAQKMIGTPSSATPAVSSENPI